MEFKELKKSCWVIGSFLSKSLISMGSLAAFGSIEKLAGPALLASLVPLKLKLKCCQEPADLLLQIVNRGRF